MKKPLEPERWTTRSRESLETRMAAAMQIAAQARALDERTVERIRTSLHETPAVRGRLAIAIATFLLIAGVGVGVTVARVDLRLLGPPRTQPTTAPFEERPNTTRPAAPAASPPQNEPKPASGPLLELAQPRRIAPRPVPRVPPVLPADPEPIEVAPPPPPGPDEAALLMRAFRSLRAGDAVAALTTLDEFDRTYPASTLRRESLAARLTAYLRSKDERRALTLLDQWPEDAGSLAQGALTTRGELRAMVGRCRDAIADFDNVMALSGDDMEHQRALFGRADCLAKLGRFDKAEADLRSYLTRFPAGAFAEQTRAALERRGRP